MIDSKQLSEIAEDFRARSVEALAVPEIQHKIGKVKASRLKMLAMGAGKMAIVDGLPNYVTADQNGLNIVPTHDGIDRDSGIDFGGVSATFGDLMKTNCPRHVGVPSPPDQGHDIIILPVDLYASLGSDERSLVGVHELTHADQHRRPARQRDRTIRHDTIREAEAYANQFAVLDHYVGGVLSTVVDRSLDPEGTIVINAGEHADLITEKFATCVAIAAALINRRYGYVPNGSMYPNKEVVLGYTNIGAVKVEDYSH